MGLKNLEIEVLSDKKGSNPGGNCRFKDNQIDFKGYFKYVYGARLLNSSCLESKHQPIYEAITFELANKLGLKTSLYYVLLNKEKNLKFTGNNFIKNHSGRDYYFISKLKKGDNVKEIGKKILENELVYLESLKIADVVGKRQNYLLLSEDSSKELKPVYIDLGCSFVHAVEGFIYVPNGLKIITSKKFDRKKLKKLEESAIILPDNESLVNLGELIETFPKMTVPTLNPWGRKQINELISECEINEIQRYLLESFSRSILNYKNKGLLI